MEQEFFIYLIKLMLQAIGSLYFMNKALNFSNISKQKISLILIELILVSVICSYIKFRVNILLGILLYIILFAFIYSKNINYQIINSIILTFFSLIINYLILFISGTIGFLIYRLINLSNLTFITLINALIYVLLLMLILKIPKMKKGIVFFYEERNSDIINLIVLNISLITIFVILLFIEYDIVKSPIMGIGMIIIWIDMLVTIYKLIQLFYKEKLLIKELEETKKELENKTKEVKNLELENLNFSKISHSLAHKQKSLEYKLNELLVNDNIKQKVNIKEELENLSKEVFNGQVSVDFPKTGIENIDDMLNYMKSECIKNKIQFTLIISGNIFYMVNNIITKEELEILIADHLKDAIIAVNHSENINKTILMKLGKLDDKYGLKIYDSGVEFKQDVLKSLGKKPITTYKDEGGTGIGFMNTFDILNKYNASLYINQIGKESKENFTKSIEIKFDELKKFLCN